VFSRVFLKPVAVKLLPFKESIPSFKSEAECVLENLVAALNEAGSSVDHVVKTVCLLSDMEHYAEFNEVTTF
jgi:enamine deaminase RidA (YjgF/YER057c/UK114 family)